MKMAQAMERGGVRLRFTIRSLMIAVAVIAGLLALLTAWTEFLPVLIVVGIPMASSAGLLARVPPHRPRWRFLILTLMLGWIILGCGWLWARSAIWVLEEGEGRGTSLTLRVSMRRCGNLPGRGNIGVP